MNSKWADNQLTLNLYHCKMIGDKKVIKQPLYRIINLFLLFKTLFTIKTDTFWNMLTDTLGQ